MTLRLTTLATALAICLCAAAEKPVTYQAAIIANASTGQFAPYMIGSWNEGRVWEGNSINLDAGIQKELDLSRRFSWGAGVEALAGYGNSAAYDRYYADYNVWGTSYNRQAPVRLQQLYGQLKYRGVYLLAGMKSRKSGIVDERLSSGDVTRSNNARPIPCISAGFIDFQNVPFTNGWLQIEGELTYGKFFDNKTIDHCFNRYEGILTQDLCYAYKRCYLRSKPSQPFCVTAGVQQAGTFAGSSTFYNHFKGNLFVTTDNRGFHWIQLWNMFFPEHNNGESNAIGSSLGSWDFKARYRFRNGSKLNAYFEWFFEDGSGIGRRNGWDGLWGLQYDFAKAPWLNKVVVEYIDFTNQAGPCHFQAVDHAGTDLTTNIGGADDYFNNGRYGPYVNYGMAIGTPFVKAPLYNTDGYWAFAHCRARGCHVAFEGNILSNLDYIVRFSTQKAWNTGRIPAKEALDDYSAGISVHWLPAPVKLPQLNVNFDFAFDAGTLRGDNVGAMLTIAYKGDFSLSKK